MIRSIEDLKHMKEAYLEKMGQYSHLCMVCYGTGCMSSGCKDVRDAMVEELEKAGENKKMNQYFAVLTDTRTVGVMGDGRSYDRVLALRAVTTEDFMTADFSRLPWELLDTVSRRIVNEVKYINRVMFDYTTKPPATIEFE